MRRTRESGHMGAGERSTCGWGAPSKNWELIRYDGFVLAEICAKRL